MLLHLLNRLLEHDAASREALAKFASRRVRIEALPIALSAEVNERGYLVEAAADPSKSFDVTIQAPLSAAPLALLGKDRFTAALHVQGNVAFAHALSTLFERAPLAIEAETERWVGPVIAHRVAQIGQAIARQARAVQGSVERQVPRALTGEAKPLPTGEEVRAWQSEVSAASQRVAALESRIARLMRDHKASA